MERLHIIDGYGYVYRAYYGLAGAGGGPRLTTSEGAPTGALYVFAQMLLRLRQDVDPSRVVVVFDAPGPSFRHRLDPDYKATRRETPEDLKVQLPHFRPLTEAFAWPVIAVPEVEADDVIATLATEARDRGWDVTIFSADKDLMQLVDGHVEVIDSMRQRTYDRDAVVEKFGVEPTQVADWLALVGDASDNIPGVAGVGKKTATRLLLEYGTIDGVLAHSEALKGKMRERFEDPMQLERLELSRKLVALKRDVKIGRDVEDLVPQPWDGAELRRVFESFEFHALLGRLDPRPEAEDDPMSVDDPDAIVAGSWDELDSLMDAARAAGHIAIDWLTTSERPDRSRIVGLALVTDGHRPVYAPIGHRYLSAPKQLDPDFAPQSLRGIFKGDGDIALYCHDGKGLRRALKRSGFAVDRVSFDTMLAGYLVDANVGSERLEVLAKNHVGSDVPAAKSVFGSGRKAVSSETVAVEAAAAYSGARVCAIAALVPRLRGKLEAVHGVELLRDLEIPLSLVLADVEDRGISVDVGYLAGLSDEVGGTVAKLESEAFELAGDPFNLSSPKQLSRVLFDKLGLRTPRMKKTKSGAYSTDHEVLSNMVTMHPLVPLLLEHRELTKLKGTYIDALPPLVHPTTRRLHTSFRQAVAATGRLSSQDPNLQNIPIRSELGRRIRRAFVATSGRKLVSADYSQIELRILAHLSEDPVLVSAFRNDTDVHTQTAAEVFGVALEDVDSKQRRVAKAVNYGLVYGQSEFGLARALDIGREEAGHYIERYFERFSTVKTFMTDVVDQARERGVAETVLGRRRPIPDLRSKNFRLRTAAERIAQNMPMQGSAADIMKLAMLRVETALSAYDASVLLTVHDELVIESDAEIADEVATLVAREMAQAYELRIPLKVDVGIADDWSGAH